MIDKLFRCRTSGRGAKEKVKSTVKMKGAILKTYQHNT